jgi:hypothetical protein
MTGGWTHPCPISRVYYLVQTGEEDDMRTMTLRLGMLVLGLTATPALAQGIAPLNGGDPVAAQADATGAVQIETLLQEADRAARQGRLPLASELVERAETLVLTRSTIAGTETVPIRDGAVASLAQARQALSLRDVPAATTAIAEAQGMTRGM